MGYVLYAVYDAQPHMMRDKSGVMSNDIWCSDHHRADMFVKNSTGHVVRPWLTVFTDIRSTKVMSFIVREADPNTTVVKKCLKLGIEKYGVPNEIYTYRKDVLFVCRKGKTCSQTACKEI